MPGFKLEIDSAAFARRASAYAEKLQAKLEEEWPRVLQACIDDVLTRTPDPVTEFRYIQGYDGGITFRGTRNRKTAKAGKNHRGPRSFGARNSRGRRLLGGEESIVGDLKVKTDRTSLRQPQNLRKTAVGPGYRISFMRYPGMWLDELVQDPSTREVRTGNGNFFIGLGVIPALEAGSRFSWQNYSSRRGLGAQTHTSEYGMWSFFEEGKSGTQVARFGNRDYKLKPYEDESESYWQTHKFYPRKAMYGNFDTAIFRDAVLEIVRQVIF